MIKFSETPTKFERLDDPSQLEGYQSIRPSGDISKKEAQSFWDDLFAEPIEDDDEIENRIKQDVYGRSEEDFTFDIDVKSKEIQESLTSFKETTWNGLDNVEKETAIVALEEAIASSLGINETPRIEFYEGEKWDCGSYVPDKNLIRVNRNNFDSPLDLVNTIAHETRHAYQFQRACNIENYMDFLYAYNFTHYITPVLTRNGYVNFIEYQDQLVEAEARAFADIFEREVEGNE